MFWKIIKWIFIAVFGYIAILWIVAFFGNLFVGNFGMCAFMVLLPILAVIVYGKPLSTKDILWFIHDKK